MICRSSHSVLLLLHFFLLLKLLLLLLTGMLQLLTARMQQLHQGSPTSDIFVLHLYFSQHYGGAWHAPLHIAQQQGSSLWTRHKDQPLHQPLHCIH
jgi:hypothetical protein